MGVKIEIYPETPFLLISVAKSFKLNLIKLVLTLSFSTPSFLKRNRLFMFEAFVLLFKKSAKVYILIVLRS